MDLVQSVKRIIGPTLVGLVALASACGGEQSPTVAETRNYQSPIPHVSALDTIGAAIVDFPFVTPDGKLHYDYVTVAPQIFSDRVVVRTYSADHSTINIMNGSCGGEISSATQLSPETGSFVSKQLHGKHIPRELRDEFKAMVGKAGIQPNCSYNPV